MTVREIGPADICVWPDGAWCLHEDLGEFGWKSDDYEVVPAGSQRAQEIAGEEA